MKLKEMLKEARGSASYAYYIEALVNLSKCADELDKLDRESTRRKILAIHKQLSNSHLARDVEG